MAGLATWKTIRIMRKQTRKTRHVVKTEVRIERDSMGEVKVPARAYFGAQTQRALENFPISGIRLAPELIHALGFVKCAAGIANHALGQFTTSVRNALTDEQVEAILSAAREVASGSLDDEFPIDVFQTGSGTSSNMNANEVIANRAIELLGGDRFQASKIIHPNDHVNLGQSTNDIFPTAIHVAVSVAIQTQLIPALQRFHRVLVEKAQAWDRIIKIGRTHLTDATPIRLGQEASGFARQLELSVQRATQAIHPLLELPIGGTAVGTGINTHPEFARLACEALAAETRFAFHEALNHFEANAQRDGLVECHGQLRLIAVSLFNVSNNIRWLSSGPRCGFSELLLPECQPGSSIMPGKINPVMCECLMQVAARVIGNDQTVAFSGATGGQFQLNIMMPVMGQTTLESVTLLANGTSAFVDSCAQDMQANVRACEDSVEQSLAIVTGLTRYLGYEKSAALAKEALQSGKTIRELCLEQSIFPENQLIDALNLFRMTEPNV